MRKLVKCLFLVLLMQFLSVLPGSSNLWLPVVHATPAIKVINDTITAEKINLAQFTIMGAAIQGEKNIIDSNGAAVCIAEGRVEPAVSCLNINITGFLKTAAKASITIKAYDNRGFEGEAISIKERILKTQDGENLDLSCKHDIAANVKSVIVELKYNGVLKIYKLLVV